MKTTEQKVIKFIKDNSLLEKGDKLLIGLSGGPDSVFALMFFLKFQKKYDIEIAALHINHQLRGADADADEKFCADLCSREGIKYFSEMIDVQSFSRKNKLSIEEAARYLRYQLFEKMAEQYKCSKIVTAHNMSDNTETVLLNLIKGTGIKGLSGIPVNRGNIIRPFLALTKDEIIGYLNKKKISYALDKSNDSNEYQRNFIRNKLVPEIKDELNPAVDSAIFRTSKNLNKTNKIVSRQIESIINESGEIKSTGGVLLFPLTLLKECGVEITSEVIRHTLKRNLNSEIDHKDISKIIGLFTKQVGKSEELKNGFVCFRERRGIKIGEKVADSTLYRKLKTGSSVKLFNKKLSITKVSAPQLNKGRNKNCEYIDSKGLAESFEVRNWKRGDKFIPLGMNNFKTVSDFLTDLKIRSSEKKNQLVLLNRNQIVWVVGFRIDERFKMTDQTKETVRLCLN